MKKIFFIILILIILCIVFQSEKIIKYLLLLLASILIVNYNIKITQQKKLNIFIIILSIFFFLQAGLYVLSQISYTKIDRTICVRESCTTTVDIIGGQIREIIFPIFIVLLLIKLGLLIRPTLKQKIYILIWKTSKCFIITIGIIFIIFFSWAGITKAGFVNNYLSIEILNPEKKLSDFILPPLLNAYITLSGSCPIGMIKEQWFIYENGQTKIHNCIFSYPSCPEGQTVETVCGIGQCSLRCLRQGQHFFN